MKKIEFNKLLSLLLLLTVLVGCKEDEIGQFPIDGVAPASVSNVKVTNLKGAVSLEYDLPKDKDMLYVKAIYELSEGFKMETTQSVFSNKMSLTGFARSREQTIQLFCVDKSRNMSSPTDVVIKPDDSFIYTIRDSIIMQPRAGGFRLTWAGNPDRETFSIVVMREEMIEGTPQMSYVTSIYSDRPRGLYTAQGLDDTERTYAYFVRDVFENSSDTVSQKLKPMFQEVIPKDNFSVIPTNLAFMNTGTSHNKNMDKLWDGKAENSEHKQSCYLFAAIRDGIVLKQMPFITFSLGVTAKITQFKMWAAQRNFPNDAPKYFQMWGTSDQAAANDNTNFDYANDPRWYKIGDFESQKASELPKAAMNDEDKDYMAKDINKGMLFDLDVPTPPIKYIRFQTVETWGHRFMDPTLFCTCLGEFSFWGVIQK